MDSIKKYPPTQLYIKILDCNDAELQCMDAINQIMEHFLHTKNNDINITETFQVARVAHWTYQKYGIPPESIG